MNYEKIKKYIIHNFGVTPTEKFDVKIANQE